MQRAVAAEHGRSPLGQPPAAFGDGEAGRGPLSPELGKHRGRHFDVQVDVWPVPRRAVAVAVGHEELEHGRHGIGLALVPTARVDRPVVGPGDVQRPLDHLGGGGVEHETAEQRTIASARHPPRPVVHGGRLGVDDGQCPFLPRGDGDGRVGDVERLERGHQPVLVGVELLGQHHRCGLAQQIALRRAEPPVGHRGAHHMEPEEELAVAQQAPGLATRHIEAVRQPHHRRTEAVERPLARCSQPGRVERNLRALTLGRAVPVDQIGQRHRAGRSVVDEHLHALDRTCVLTNLCP